ncbi:MAG: hypothetical protein AB7W16_26260 [Candidatus Obscuribacterales bacterium]
MTGIASPGITLRTITARLICILALAGCSAGEKQARTDWKDELRHAKIAAFADNLDDAGRASRRSCPRYQKEAKQTEPLSSR